MTKPLCRHCTKSVSNRPRGLCWGCYEVRGIRNLYKAQSSGCDKEALAEADDMTEEQLDQMIAEQMPTMPGGKPEGMPKRRQWTLPICRCSHKVKMQTSATSHRFLL